MSKRKKKKQQMPVASPTPDLHGFCMASIYCGSGIVLACDSCWKRVFG